jgi:hypothetical protein
MNESHDDNDRIDKIPIIKKINFFFIVIDEKYFYTVFDVKK